MINKIGYLFANSKQPHTWPRVPAAPSDSNEGSVGFRISHMYEAKSHLAPVFPRGFFKVTPCPLGPGGFEVFVLFLLLLLEKTDWMGARAPSYIEVGLTRDIDYGAHFRQTETGILGAWMPLEIQN
jgi:hypothetical protein